MVILILVLLTLLNGFFALSEIAIVSVRKNRIERKAREGNKNAQIILELLHKPEAFLSSVQVGITLVGIISGAYAGTALSDEVKPWLLKVGFLAPYADGLSITLVIAGITYFSIVVGELFPKTLALSNPEKIALLVAPIIKVFTSIALPLVKLLAVSTRFIVRLFHVKTPAEEKISEEDLRQILKTAGRQGLLAKEESEFHQNLFYFSRQKARNMQTHRKELEWIDLNAPLETIKAHIHESIHSKFPVADGTLDNLVGVLTTKDFYEFLLQPDQPLRSILKKPIYVSETMLAGAILNLFRKHKQYLGVVVDEFGAVEGIITLHDILEANIDDPESMKRALAGAYGAYFVTFYWEHFSPEKEMQEAKNMAQIAKEAGLQHVIWSTLEDSRKYIPLEDESMPTLQGKFKVPHFDGKGEADHFFTDAGVPVTILLTTFYWENMIYFGMGPKRTEDGSLAIMFPMGDKKLAGIASEDIGKCAYGIFKKGPEMIGKTVGIAGEKLTCQQMAASLSKALGQEVKYQEISPETYRNLGFPGADDLGNMFQFYRDFEEVFDRSRDTALARQLNPELQNFETWLSENAKKIPLE